MTSVIDTVSLRYLRDIQVERFNRLLNDLVLRREGRADAIYLGRIIEMEALNYQHR